jgi:hypothetical protein
MVNASNRGQVHQCFESDPFIHQSTRQARPSIVRN